MLQDRAYNFPAGAARSSMNQHDLARLASGGHITGEAINLIGQKVMQRDQHTESTDKPYIASTYFYTKLASSDKVC